MTLNEFETALLAAGFTDFTTDIFSSEDVAASTVYSFEFGRALTASEISEAIR